jgi:hypothetical protein
MRSNECCNGVGLRFTISGYHRNPKSLTNFVPMRRLLLNEL